MKELENIVKMTQEVLKKREVNLASTTLASLIASLSELGILTQGTVNALARYFVPRICAYITLSKEINPNDPMKSLMDVFKEYAFKESDVNLVQEDGEISIEIVTDNCKICPKGVGGAEIPGSACPVPYFVSICLSLLTKEQWKPEVERRGNKVGLVVKEGGRCKMRIKKVR